MTNTNQDREYHTTLEIPEVKAALHEYDSAQAKRDSISRKLCGGSTAVTVTDLARWEDAVSTARSTLTELVRRTPILERHPTFAAAVAHH